MRIWILLVVLCCTGCAQNSRGTFQALQTARQNECLREPSVRYMEECLARNRMSYTEYEILLQEQTSQPGK